MNKVYIVTGVSGEHCDKRSWSVKAYGDQWKAIGHVEELNRLLTGSDTWSYEKRDEFKTDLDPFCYIDYTGTRYYVEELDYE